MNEVYSPVSYYRTPQAADIGKTIEVSRPVDDKNSYRWRSGIFVGKSYHMPGLTLYATVAPSGELIFYKEARILGQ